MIKEMPSLPPEDTFADIIMAEVPKLGESNLINDASIEEKVEDTTIAAPKKRGKGAFSFKIDIQDSFK